MHIAKLHSGREFDIYGLAINKQCLVQQFVSKLDIINQKQVYALFKVIGEQGPPSNEEKFRHLGEGIYELKTRRGVRILSFFWGASFEERFGSYPRVP